MGDEGEAGGLRRLSRVGSKMKSGMKSVGAGLKETGKGLGGALGLSSGTEGESDQDRRRTTSDGDTDEKRPSRERKRDRFKKTMGKVVDPREWVKRGDTTSAEKTSGDEAKGDKGEEKGDRASRRTKRKGAKDSDKETGSSAGSAGSGDEEEEGGRRRRRRRKGGDPGGDPDGEGKGRRKRKGSQGDEDDEEPGSKRKGKDDEDDAGQMAREYQVRVVILEGKELEGGRRIDPFTRVTVGDSVQPTRTLRSTDAPLWNQNLYFTLQVSRAGLVKSRLEIRVYTGRREAGEEALIGSFETNLANVAKQPGHAYVRRWAALTRRGSEEEGTLDSGVSGFIRFSVSVLGPGQRPPPQMGLEKKSWWHRSMAIFGGDSDSDVDEDRVLFSGSVGFRSYLLVLRLHDLNDLPTLSPPSKKALQEGDAQEPYKVTVVASIAGRVVRSQPIDSNNNRINQEMRIPIKWPSIAKHLSLELFGRKKKGAEVHLGTCRLLLSEISHSGDLTHNSHTKPAKTTKAQESRQSLERQGFLPCFGPSYVTFYMMEGKAKKRRKASENAEVPSLFRGRALVEILTVDGMGDSTKGDVQPMSQTQLQTSSHYGRTEKFILFGSFFAGNMIGSRFKSEKVAFELSVGVYGNAAYPGAFPCSSRTTGVMPQYDGSHYYCMPWGSRKPCAVIPAFFEPFLYRLHAVNILQRMSKKIRDVALEVETRIGGREDPDLASEVIHLVDTLTKEIAFDLDDILPNPVDREQTTLSSMLDRSLYELRLGEAREVGRELIRLRNLPISIQHASGYLLQLADRLFELSKDPQCNIPDVVIWMMANGERVAVATIPAHRILFSEGPDGRGEDCGQLQACALRPVSMGSMADTSFAEIPALLQVRLWLGQERHQTQWRQFINPGIMHFFAESYENEKKSKLGGTWGKSRSSRLLPWSDESGALALPKEGFASLPSGWEWAKADWECSRTFDAWVDRDAGHVRFEEELYEMEGRHEATGGWHKLFWTDYDGNPTVDKRELLCPPNWEWSGDWVVDKVCPGDDKGWVYVSTRAKPASKDMRLVGPAFNSDFDCAERRHHSFRRRRWVRRRILSPKGAKGGPMIKDGDPDGWEFATNLANPTHLRHRPEDRIRRRRWHREVKLETEEEEERSQRSRSASGLGQVSLFSKLCIRVNTKAGGGERDAEAAEFRDVPFHAFIIHQKVHKWQLRAYIFQARDLFHSSSSNTNTFARVVFMNRCQVTKVLVESVNPMYQQTLIFEKVLITGSAGQLRDFPPVVAVEVYADRQGLPPEFLGRSICQVKSVATVAGIRDQTFTSAHLRWHPLEYLPGKFHGDVLAAFELYEADHPEFVPALPAEKPKKEGAKPVYEVPRHIRPTYKHWNIEFVCWGVRNLKRYQMTSVRHPFVEFIVSNQQVVTNTLVDSKKNPNFEDPLKRLENVRLPVEVNLSTPIQIQLRDQRSFGRRPLIGVCLIKDFRQYEVEAMGADDSDVEREERLAALLEGEEEEVRPLGLHRRTRRGRNDDASQTDAQTEAASALAGGLEEGNLGQASDAVPFDWWSKFYASAGESDKASGYGEFGLETLRLFPGKLEEIAVYENFEDFCQTFPVYRIQRLKGSDPENCEFQGEIKGRLLMYRQDRKDYDAKGYERRVARELPGWEFKGPVPCCVRVYVVRGRGLRSRKRDGSMSTFVQVRLGGKKLDSKRRSRQEAGNPEYGELFEFKSVTVPQDKDLVVSLFDRRTVGPSVELGTTKIDLENRVLTKWRATVGLPAQFHTGGLNAWRDQWTPLRILLNYARVHQLPQVSVTRDKGIVITLGKTTKTSKAFVFREQDLDLSLPGGWREWEGGELGSVRQQLALHVLRRLAMVPEHVETRALENTLDPSRSGGSLQMWVDVFPLSYGPVPPPVNIRPRQPIPMQLRMVVWEARDCVVTKESMGQKVGDLCVRAFIEGLDKGQKTDVHYRSLDGSGKFNWRMVFDFDYSPWDRQIVAQTRRHFWRRKEAKKLNPVLIIQVLDNNKFSKDSIIGELRLNLMDCEVGQAFPDSMKNVERAGRGWGCGGRGPTVVRRAVPESGRTQGGRDPASSSRLGCCGGRRTKSLERVSLLSQKRHKGWWVVSKTGTGEQKGTEGQDVVTGKVQLEMGVVEQSAAEADPVGKGRKGPNHSPELGKPDRPFLDRHWLTSRFGLFKSLIWKKWKWWIIAGLCIAFVALILLFIFFHGPSLFARQYIPNKVQQA